MSVIFTQRWVIRNICLVVSIICLISLISSLQVNATTLFGRVIKVTDGDSITILSIHREQVKIRLYGIDTPERRQPFSRRAKEFTASLVAGKNVRVEVYDTDRYGRTVGVVYVDGINVNQKILKAGYAWQYRKYCKAPFCSDWLKHEQDAKAAKKGLWADSKAMPPWEWRRKNRN